MNIDFNLTPLKVAHVYSCYVGWLLMRNEPEAEAWEHKLRAQGVEDDTFCAIRRYITDLQRTNQVSIVSVEQEIDKEFCSITDEEDDITRFTLMLTPLIAIESAIEN